MKRVICIDINPTGVLDINLTLGKEYTVLKEGRDIHGKFIEVLNDLCDVKRYFAYRFN